LNTREKPLQNHLVFFAFRAANLGKKNLHESAWQIPGNGENRKRQALKFTETNVKDKIEKPICVALLRGCPKTANFSQLFQKPSRHSARLGVLSGRALSGAWDRVR
jgi:hypothetical protein